MFLVGNTVNRIKLIVYRYKSDSVSWENDFDIVTGSNVVPSQAREKLHVAVPDRRGRRTPHCAVRLQTGQESQERGGVSGRFLRVSPRGRVPGVPQAAAGHPCSGMLGACQEKIR